MVCKHPLAMTSVQKRVSELLASGHTPREIAALLGLSTQRIYAVMDALKAQAKREKEKAS